MIATSVFDIFTCLDGNASHSPPGNWGGYCGKQGSAFLGHRPAAYGGDQRMVFGATTFGLFLQMLPALEGHQRVLAPPAQGGLGDEAVQRKRPHGDAGPSLLGRVLR